LPNTGGSAQEPLGLDRAAVKLKPDFWVGYSNVQNSLWALGDEEARGPAAKRKKLKLHCLRRRLLGGGAGSVDCRGGFRSR
jgi:hypothetical protein